MTENDRFWLLPENDRCNIIAAARQLARKLDIPYGEAFDLLRQCAAVVADTDRRAADVLTAGIQPTSVDLEAFTRSFFGLEN